MLDERLFYFVHGFATMYFLMAGAYRVRRKEASRLERLCGYVLLWWFALELKDLVFYFVPVFRDNYISNQLILIDMTAISAGCYFVIEVLNPGWCTFKRAFLLGSPYLVAAFLYALTNATWIMHTAFVLSFLYSIGFTFYMVGAVRRYNRLLKENYSNFEYIHVRWLKGVAVMLAVCLIVWTCSCYFSTWITDVCYQIVLMLFWMTMLYFADRQRAPQIEKAPAVPEKSPVETSSLNAMLEQKLAQLLDEERVWMNPHLTLSDLAMQVGTNRTYLSNYLNNTLHTTFYDYINGYRLRAALTQLETGEQEMTMVELAEACGFNSTSTFRRVFVRAMGCSFVEYRNKIVPR